MALNKSILRQKVALMLIIQLKRIDSDVGFDYFCYFFLNEKVAYFLEGITWAGPTAANAAAGRLPLLLGTVQATMLYAVNIIIITIIILITIKKKLK